MAKDVGKWDNEWIALVFSPVIDNGLLRKKEGDHKTDARKHEAYQNDLYQSYDRGRYVDARHDSQYTTH